MIEVLKSTGYNSGNVVCTFGDLSQILKSETAQLFLEQMKNFCVMQNRLVAVCFDWAEVSIN